MLTIRKQQMDVLGNYMRQSFEDRMVRYLARAFPDASYKLRGTGLDDAPMRNLIQRAVERARRYQIRSERDLASYLEFVMLFGLEFELRPDLQWTQAVLTDQKSEGDDKIALLQKLMVKRRPEYLAFHGSPR